MRGLTETALARTASMLADKYDIRVIFKGKQALTDGKTITVPSVPNDASEEFIDALTGFIDHEAAHILFTDMKEGQTTDKALWHCYMIIEDIYVERRMEELFPGACYNLLNCRSFTLKKLRNVWDDLPPFFKILTSLFVRERHLQSDFVDNFIEPEIRERVEELHNIFCARIDNTSGTKENMLIAKDLLACLEAEAEEAAEEIQACEDSLREAFTTAGLDKAIAQQADYEHGQAGDDSYLIYSTENDFVGYVPLHHEGKGRLAELRGHSKVISGVMQRRLVNSLRTLQRARWVGGKEEGKYDARRLYRAVLLDDSSVHVAVEKRNVLDVAVAMMIDHSSSMSGPPIRLAAESAIVHGDVLSKLNVPFLAYGYSTQALSHNIRDEDLYARWNSIWLGVYHGFNDKWQRSAERLATAHHNVQANTLDGEALLFGVRQLMNHPAKRKILIVFNDGMPYPGHGNTGRCQIYLKSMEEQARKAGVEIFAYGVLTDAVRHYYKNWTIINELDDLVKEPLIKLDGLLRKGLR